MRIRFTSPEPISRRSRSLLCHGKRIAPRVARTPGLRVSGNSYCRLFRELSPCHPERRKGGGPNLLSPHNPQPPTHVIPSEVKGPAFVGRPRPAAVCRPPCYRFSLSSPAQARYPRSPLPHEFRADSPHKADRCCAMASTNRPPRGADRPVCRVGDHADFSVISPCHHERERGGRFNRRTVHSLNARHPSEVEGTPLVG